MDYPQRPNRVSPDSHRTISDANRFRRSEHPGRSRENLSGREARTESRMEWQTVRSVERLSVDHGRARDERDERETEEEKRRRLKGKAIATDINAMEARPTKNRGNGGTLIIGDQRQLVPENQVHSDNMGAYSISPGENQKQNQEIETICPPLIRALNITEPEQGFLKPGPPRPPPSENKEVDPKLYTEEEMNQFADQYASVDIEMDEEMLDNDDLLDEDMEKETQVPETQVIARQSNAEKRLSTNMIRVEEGRDKQRKIRPEAGTGMLSPQKKKIDREERSKQQLPSNGKRRGARSPDAKGTAASKKLALRGRSIPRGKLIRHNRLSATVAQGSTMVPRSEVYPSAIRGRKLSSKLVLVGSQKPPNKNI